MANAKMSLEFNPCPFCGEDMMLLPNKSGQMWNVTCNWCGAVGPNHTNIMGAVEEWNTRLTKEERDALEKEREFDSEF